MPSTLSSPYAGRPAGWVRTGGAAGVRARSYGPGRPHVSTPAYATTRLHAPRRVRSRALRGRRPGVSGVAPGPSALRGRSVHPEARPPGEVPARLPYVVERGGRVRRTPVGPAGRPAYGHGRTGQVARTSARRRTRQHACTPRDVSARVLYVVDARGSLE